MSYWDTSALAKLYVSEADSRDFETHAAKTSQLTVSVIGRLELRTVLRRREGEGSLSLGSTDVLYRSFCSLIKTGQFVEEPMTPDLEAEFFAILDSCLGQSPPIFLRTNDALHLAAARRANETEVVSTDKGLRRAARFLGFNLFPAHEGP
jgi:predicted nucleic acid-binding protein